MTREEAKRRAELYSAVANGKTIQIQCANGEWSDVQNSALICIDDDRFKYRVKPKPKFRPFRTQEECWNEMHKHPDFGWIKRNVTGEYKQVIRVFGRKTELIFNISYNGFADYSPEIMFSCYTFTDGAPFGIKEE